MTQTDPKKSKWLRGIIAVALAVLLAVGVYLVWPNRGGNKIVAYFPTAVGLYPGDEVRVVGVPVGRIDAIEPRATDVKISMTVQGDVRVPADARALIIAPNLVSARFIQLTPGLHRWRRDGLGRRDRVWTVPPSRWNGTRSRSSSPRSARNSARKEGGVQGPLTAFVNQAADTFDGNGDSFRQALRELSQTAGRLGDSRTDLFGTVRNLQVLVDALANSNEQIVQFTNHVSSVSQVLASSSQDLDNTLGVLNQALGDVKGLLGESNGELIESVGKLADFTQILTDHSDDIEQILHITPNGLANFYNIYNPAQGTVGGLLSLPNFANPVQFICGGTFDTGASPDNYKRAEICRQRMGPVLKRITMNYPPMLLHPVDSITAYKGQIIYDTPATEAKARTPVPYLQWQPAPGVTPPTVGPEGNLSELILPPPAVVGQISPAGPAPSQMSPAEGRASRTRRSDDGRGRRMTRILLRSAALGTGALMLAGCQFGGLNSLNMPGTAGHGPGSYRITVELPDVATLPQNSPVMLDDVTVGSVSGIEAVQRPDGTFYAAVQLSLDSNVDLPENATATVAQTSLLGSQHVQLAEPMAKPVGKLKQGSHIPSGSIGRYPTTEEVLSSLGVVVNKGNLGALQDIMDEAHLAVAGRTESFAGLLPRLAELTASLDQQTDDIITAAEGLNRFAANPGPQQGQCGPHPGQPAQCAEGAQRQPGQHRLRVRRTAEVRCRRFPDPVGDQGGFRRRHEGPVPADQGVQRQRRRSDQGPGVPADVPVPLQVPAQRGAR